MAEYSFHYLLLVTSAGRFEADEVRMVKFLCENLFESSLRDRVILVVTTSPQNHVEDKEEAQHWLDEESNDKTPFSMCYDLINRDSNKVVFVNNNNLESSTNPETYKKYKKENVKMAQKVLDVVHKEATIRPVSISSAVKRAFDSIKELDEQIKRETDKAKRRQLSKFFQFRQF